MLKDICSLGADLSLSRLSRILRCDDRALFQARGFLPLWCGAAFCVRSHHTKQNTEKFANPTSSYTRKVCG